MKADVASEADVASQVDVATDAEGTLPEGSDGGSDAGPVDASIATDGAGLLSLAQGHLRLWLEADQGVTCSNGRVTEWADQSGHGDDAKLLLGQLGPQCQVPGAAHTIAGVDVPFFSAPANGNIVDETLDVDLSFLVNTNYTLFAVERRWADPDVKVRRGAYVLGTDLPGTESTVLDCTTKYASLLFGYENVNAMMFFGVDNGCEGIMTPVFNAPAGPPAPLSEDTGKFDTTDGMTLWVNSVEAMLSQSSSFWTTPLSTYTEGAIGRAVLKTDASPFDQRFDGDIAEILVYDVALDDPERKTVEAYLKAKWQY